MRSAKTITTIAIFTSLIIASDYALVPALNIKLMDTLVFSSAYAFGFKIGASIAILSELIWSVVTPYGFYLPITPFLVGGELLFAIAGFLVSRLWQADEISPLASENLLFGGVLAICAFFWDFETNIATGLLAGAHSLVVLLGFEVAGIYFMIGHEVSDFIFGSTLAPIIILYFNRHLGRMKNQVTTSSTIPDQFNEGT
jgi:hypothetical protein